jgi:serine/threonine protein kinase
MGIIDGLQFLHSCRPPIIHGDIRAVYIFHFYNCYKLIYFQGNILVSGDGIPLLADFGLSHVMDNTIGMTTSSNIAGSLRWMSRELIYNDKPNEKSDVWAVGMTILVCVTVSYKSSIIHSLTGNTYWRTAIFRNQA